MIFIKDYLDSNEEKLKSVARLLNKSKTILLSGVGDKYYSCLITQFLADSYYKKPLRVMHSRLVTNYTPEWIDKESVCIFISESGSTQDVLDAIKAVHDKKAKIVIITSRNSPIENVDLQIVANGGVNALLCHMNMIILYALMELNEEVTSLFTVQNIDLPWDLRNMEKNEDLDTWVKDTAAKIKKLGLIRFYFLGDGPRYPAASIGARMNKYESHIFRSEGFDQNIPYDSKSAVILLKPRDSQVSEQAATFYSIIKDSFRNVVFEIDPFKYMEPKGIGKRMDILLAPLYILIMEKLFNELSKEDSTADSIP